MDGRLESTVEVRIRVGHIRESSSFNRVVSDVTLIVACGGLRLRNDFLLHLRQLHQVLDDVSLFPDSLSILPNLTFHVALLLSPVGGCVLCLDS